MDINTILLNLEIINQIKEGDKLAINVLPGSTKLFVDNNNFFLPARRWYNGYNREDSIKFIEQLVNTIENTSEIFIDGSHKELGYNLKNAITNSIKGLTELKNTYSNDSIIIARLILIINRLNKIIINLDNIHIHDNIVNNISINDIKIIENNN